MCQNVVQCLTARRMHARTHPLALSLEQMKVKVPLCTSWSSTKLCSFLTSALDGGEWAISRRGTIHAGEEAPSPLNMRPNGIHSRYGEEKNSLTRSGIRASNHYTCYAIAFPLALSLNPLLEAYLPLGAESFLRR